LNLLIDGLPEEVEIAGQTVRISTGFRTGILFEEVLQDHSLDDADKLQTALELYFPGVVFDYEVLPEAVNRLIWFYRCGSDPTETKDTDEAGSGEDPPYSYEHDADYIYAAFRQAYGIDLARETLHWWQFRALFRSLPEDTQMVKIIGYRTMKIPASATTEQRQHYEKMKRIYALPEDADRLQLESDLNTLLMNGGDPSALLRQ
jgi:hypothetical protein